MSVRALFRVVLIAVAGVCTFLSRLAERCCGGASSCAMGPPSIVSASPRLRALRVVAVPIVSEDHDVIVCV